MKITTTKRARAINFKLMICSPLYRFSWPCFQYTYILSSLQTGLIQKPRDAVQSSEWKQISYLVSKLWCCKILYKSCWVHSCFHLFSWACVSRYLKERSRMTLSSSLLRCGMLSLHSRLWDMVIISHKPMPDGLLVLSLLSGAFSLYRFSLLPWRILLN